MSFLISRPRDTVIPQGFPASVRTIDSSEQNMLFWLKVRSLKSLRTTLRAHLAEELGVTVRSVIAYREHTVNYGGCETCSLEETIFDVYFRDQGGRVLLWRYDGYFTELIRKLEQSAAELREL